MTDETRQPVQPQVDATTDSGLTCLRCDYSLTGLTSDRCPECGTPIDWPATRLEHENELRRKGPVWGRWPWYLAPAAFVVTAAQVAFLPWVFADRLPARPRLRSALAFLGLCMGMALVTTLFTHHGDEPDHVMWGIGVACEVVLQTALFGWLLQPYRVRHSYRFWFAVTAYTSYPLLMELFRGPPFILQRASNVWPFSMWGSNHPDWLTSLLYHWWWAGLAIMAWVRLPRRRRWRIALMIASIPALTYISSYTGCYLGEKLG